MNDTMGLRPDERRNRTRADQAAVPNGLRLVWDRDQHGLPQAATAPKDGLMLCVGVTPGEDGEPDLMWVHTMQGELLLAAEGNEVHRAWDCFAPLTALPGAQVGRFLEHFNALTSQLFAASERPPEVRSTTPVRVSVAEIQALMQADVRAA